MGRQAPDGLLGVPPNLLTAVLAHRDQLPAESEQERAARDAVATFRERRLRLLPRDGHAAADDRLRAAGFTRRPGGLAARPRHRQLLQDRRAFVDGQPPGNLTREHILDNITLYWLTGTGASAARNYWEDGRAGRALAAGQAPPPVVRAGWLHDVPRRDLGHPAQLGRAAYPDLAYFNEVDKGGHFAAWEEPELFSAEVRAAFRDRCAR